MPLAADAFYLIDHRLIALVMVVLLLLACEIGYRLSQVAAAVMETIAAPR